MDRKNVDTDAIIPKQFLKSIKKSGFGINLFDEWRYLDAGFPGQDPGSCRPNPDFVLNQPRYRGASVLIARKNFGCGSSREHAPWALDQYGFRVVIAPSFADIFFDNCFKNGLLPIVLPESQVASLFDEVAHTGQNYDYELNQLFFEELDIRKPDHFLDAVGDIAAQTIEQVIIKADGTEVPFEVQAFRKYCLLNGFDDIGLTLRHADKIKAYEAERLLKKPWLAHSL